MPIRILLLALVLVVVGAACETGQVDRDRFDAMVEERDEANRRLIEAVEENDVLRIQAQELVDVLEATQAAIPESVDEAFYVELLAAYDRAWSRRDLDEIMALYADDAVVELAVEGIVRRGSASIREFFGEFLAGYGAYSQESEVIRPASDSVVFLWEASGTRTDGSLQLFAGGTLFEIEDLLIVRQVDYALFP